jgi:predicted site-specific integrase-resolvase
MRRREVANYLAISQSMVAKLERRGALQPVRLPDVRSVRYRTEDVQNLLQSWTTSPQPAGVA